ncbi:Uncharacterised protein [Bordetella pertussis]|nr:Uncharacterised protein [Bordetella pertussis]CFL89587.1 Uncharacterised protein [Bordetella pertussis]CFM05465.1 Uncharacterised protein [Bordetella pertussis]CFM12147.1 Uncharacterised protein [Bordetella pertussis]CFM29420.1 Uncharacterised protein [Bordetella pertussis]
MMALRDNPPLLGSLRKGKNTLVATTTSSRGTYSRKARPRNSSLVPSE